MLASIRRWHGAGLLGCPWSAPLRADAGCRPSAQLELERKVQVLLVEERNRAAQEAELAMRLCTGASMPP